MKILLSHKITPEVKGIFLYSIAIFFIAVMNLCAKALQPEYHAVEITFWRNIIALIFVAGFIVYSGRQAGLKTKRVKAHLLRGFIGTAGITAAFLTYGLLPAAEATVLLFTSPLFVAALSYPMLREKVGVMRSLAILVGFAGVLIIAQPQNISSFEGIAAGLLAGLSSALVSIFLRDLGKTEDPWITVFYFLLIGSIVTGLAVPFIGSVPQGYAIALFILAGFLGVVNQSTKTMAFLYAPAATIAPLMFSMLIWTTLFGWLIWDEIPGIHTFLGAGIIIFANLFILWREQSKKRLSESQHS